ncbi:MAG: hypothetical protein ABF586_09290 [Sporolactobacillus sp.]
MMRAFIQTPHSLQVKPGLYGLSMVQWLIVIASGGLAFLTKFVVHPALAYVYVAYVPITVYGLFFPSPHSAGKTMGQELWLVLWRDRRVYGAIRPPVRPSMQALEKRDTHAL